MQWRDLAERFCADCAEAACRFDGSETSGARTTRRNRRVGGARLSKHKTSNGGLARDFVFRTGSGREGARRWLRSRGWFPFVGDDYGPYRLHVQGLPKGTDPRAVLSGIPTPTVEV